MSWKTVSDIYKIKNVNIMSRVRMFLFYFMGYESGCHCHVIKSHKALYIKTNGTFFFDIHFKLWNTWWYCLSIFCTKNVDLAFQHADVNLVLHETAWIVSWLVGWLVGCCQSFSKHTDPYITSSAHELMDL